MLSNQDSLKLIFCIFVIQLFLLFCFIFISRNDDNENEFKISNNEPDNKELFYDKKDSTLIGMNKFAYFSDNLIPRIIIKDFWTNIILNNSMPKINKNLLKNIRLNRYKNNILTLNKILEPMINRWQFSWISNRIKKLWLEIDSQLITKFCDKNQSKNILIIPGMLTLTDFAHPKRIKSGGPLGELLQWADLILSCHLLCHQVSLQIHFPSAIADLRVDMASDSKDNVQSGCDGFYHLIFTDISGFRSLPEDILRKYKKKFMILDAFGTEAAYNSQEYASKHSLLINRWGGLNLNLKQFLTMFPHSPDNSFIGFIIEPIAKYNSTLKEDYALIIGKEARYIKEMESVLPIIQKYLKIKATFYQSGLHYIPAGIQLIGVLTSQEYKNLLFQSKVCIGMGEPIESPSPLYAVAAGCIFLNPLTSNHRFHGKPTSRIIKSQHDYLLKHIGAPHVISYNKSNSSDVEKAILSAINQTSLGVIPYPFSINGYLNRLKNIINDVSECNIKHTRLKSNLLLSTIGKFNINCVDTCYKSGLICEPEYFSIINDFKEFQRKGISCLEYKVVTSPHMPAFTIIDRSLKDRDLFVYIKHPNMKMNSTHIMNSNNKFSHLKNQSNVLKFYDAVCYIQPVDNPIFSCAGIHSYNLTRICPCRKYFLNEF